MNPPFSAAGNRGITKDQAVAQKHVEQALLTLRDGGRLVAILPGGRSGFPTQGAALYGGWAPWWEKIAGQYNVVANVLLPGKEYAKYGTTYPIRLVVIDKTGPTPGDTPDARKSAILDTEAEDLDAALAIAVQLGKDRPEAVPANAPGPVGTGPRPGTGNGR